MATATRIIKAPRGTTLTCKGWPQEAALRMLMNTLDPDVAERPDDLVVYGGSGKAARNWQAFDAIVRSLTTLEHDETLLVQSGKPVGVFQTHPGAPRVLIANGLLVPAWATWDNFRELEHRGLVTAIRARRLECGLGVLQTAIELAATRDARQDHVDQRAASGDGDILR